MAEAYREMLEIKITQVPFNITNLCVCVCMAHICLHMHKHTYTYAYTHVDVGITNTQSTQVDTAAKNVSKDKLMVLAKGATNSYRRCFM